MPEPEYEEEDDFKLPPLPGMHSVFPRIDDYYKNRPQIEESTTGIPPLPMDSSDLDHDIRDAVNDESIMPAFPEEVSPKEPDVLNKPSPRSGPKQIYVKLSKYQEARDSLGKVQQKLNEIDGLLRSLRGIRQDEEKELQGWEKEFQNIQARLKQLSSDVFESGETG